MGHARVPCGQHREGWRFAAAGQGGSVFPAEAGSPVECAGASTHQGDDAAEVGKKVRFGIGKLKGATRWMVVLLRRWVKPHGPLAGWLRNLVNPGLLPNGPSNNARHRRWRPQRQGPALLASRRRPPAEAENSITVSMRGVR